MVTRRLSYGTTRDAFRPAPIFLLLVGLFVLGCVQLGFDLGHASLRCRLRVDVAEFHGVAILGLRRMCFAVRRKQG